MGDTGVSPILAGQKVDLAYGVDYHRLAERGWEAVPD